MGKRKMHGLSYYQCDWTGFPMRNSNCYLPDYRDGVLQKRGHYCNWEAVQAHIFHMYYTLKTLEDKDMQKMHEHIKNITGELLGGSEMRMLYGFEHLQHFNGPVGPADWHEESIKTYKQVTAIRVCPDNNVHEVDMEPFNGEFTYGDYLGLGYPSAPLVHVVTLKKIKGKSHTVDIYYIQYEDDEGEANTLATQHSKTKIRGDALYVLKSRETSFLPRDRAVDFTRETYDTLFGKKRKKVPEENALSTEQYDQMKDEMKSSLRDFEAQASSSAVTPQELVAGAKMPAPIGKELADLAEHMGHERPHKHQRSYPLVVPVAVA